jgi:hypothetical protein
LLESLERADLNTKYLVIIRHPLSLYLSTKERSLGEEVHHVRMSEIAGFFHRVEDVRGNENLDHHFLKYEDLCNKPDQNVREITNWIFPNGNPGEVEALWEKAKKIPQGRPSKPIPRDAGDEDISALKELARQYDYEWEEQPGLWRDAKAKLARYIYDVRLVTQAMSGTLDSHAVVRHHIISPPGAIIIRLLNIFPFFSSRWQAVQDAERDNVGTGTADPEDRQP